MATSINHSGSRKGLAFTPCQYVLCIRCRKTGWGGLCRKIIRWRNKMVIYYNEDQYASLIDVQVAIPDCWECVEGHE